MDQLFGAIDLGASSGRVIAGIFGNEKLELTEIHRFANGPLEDGDKLFWDFASLQNEIATGLHKLGEFAADHALPVTSVGIDTWAVDYGLLNKDGRLLAKPRNYRDERNMLGVANVDRIVDAKKQFEHNGLQFQPFNTLYQLSANQMQEPEDWNRAETLLLIPDLLGHWLTGKAVTERTNASTTGLLNVHSHEWDWELIDLLGYKRSLFTKLVDAGTVLGSLLPEFVTHPALTNTMVTVVPSHDTAAAVAGTPLSGKNSAYLSSGTWSLLGLELEAPILDSAAQKQNFTNELGVHNRIRFLKNLSGLWLLQQSLAEWQLDDPSVNLLDLLAQAATIESDSRVNVNDDVFLSPGDMPAKIQGNCSRAGMTVPKTKPEIVRCILDSLADAYAEAIRGLEEITSTKIDQLNVVGGGSQNTLLAQLTADAAGIKVVTGPVEATALGNLVCQAGVFGAAPADLAGQRSLIASQFKVSSFLPDSTTKNR